ncbi:hypothetical protein EC988_005649, partial [Linderina pennispora]
MDSSDPHLSTVHSIFERVLEPTLNRQKVLHAEQQVQELLNSRTQTEHVFQPQNKFWQAVYFKLADHYRMGSGYGQQPGQVMVIKGADACMPSTTIAQYIESHGFPLDEPEEEEGNAMNVTMIMRRRKDQSRSGRDKRKHDSRPVRSQNEQQGLRSIEEREAEYERLRAEIFQGGAEASAAGAEPVCAADAIEKWQCVPNRSQQAGVRSSAGYQPSSVRPPVRPWKQLYDPKSQP